MTETIGSIERNYSITGPERANAIAAGMADGEWWMPDIAPDRLQELMQRSNRRAAIDVMIWVAALIGAGILAWYSLGTWWAIPAFALYGALYGGSADARWHECGHGTAFRSDLLNNAVYYPACFMLAREPMLWRWSHFRHHTDTIIRGRDAEIVFPRPASFGRTAFQFTHIQGGSLMMWNTVRHAFGKIDDATLELVPEDSLRRLVWDARVFSAIWAGAIVWSVATLSIVPVLFIGGPTIYGAWLMVFFGITQHAGLQENVLDHRYSTRTVYMNPIFRFLYLNMNYHVEHHMYPAVPYHALPALHEEIKDQLAPAHPNTLHAYREIFEAFRHQSEDPNWELPDRGVPDVPGHREHIVQAFDWSGDESPDGLTDIGAADMTVGELRPIAIGGSNYVLACFEGGEVVLADRMCTHGEADLASGLVLGCELECPKHNGRFDLRTGDPTRKPIKEPLGVRPVRVRGDRLWVDLPSVE